MNEPGFLTKEQQSKLAQIVKAALLKSQNKILKFLSGWIASTIIEWLIGLIDDDILSKIKISQSIKDKLNAVIEAALDGNLTSIDSIGAQLIIEIGQIPGVNQEDEKQLVQAIIRIIISLCKKYVVK